MTGSGREVLPFITPDIRPLGGVLKEKPEDFSVTEEPLFEPSGEGEHLYVSITKRDMTTMGMLGRLSRALGIPERSFGYAGLKDKHALTTQVISIQHAAAEAVAACEVPGLVINWTVPHRHKLRPGQLRGNRFHIVLRRLTCPDSDLIAALMARAEKGGFPNYFGTQRFGFRNDTHLLGGALLRRQHERAIKLLLGCPQACERPAVQEARAAFEAGDFSRAERLFQAGYRMERQLLRYLQRAGPKYAGAVSRIPKPTKRFLISAFQSDLFNRVLAERIRADALDRLWDGDIAMKHANGASFAVTDAAAEQARADDFDISPTGPIFGKKMLRAEGRAGELEEAVLSSEQLAYQDFHGVFPGLKLSGGRRSFRLKVRDLEWNLEDGDLNLAFSLSKGCYATVFLRELIKPDDAVARFQDIAGW